MRETIGSGTTAKVLDFVYDNNGKPFALTYTNGTTEPDTYYYVLNIQGDVVALMTASRQIVARYTYNAWGKVLSVTNDIGTAITSASHIANLNPIRYRGYYYDTETGFYYLQSRYYDPVNCRFINADGYASTGTGFLGYNMFAYCNNNPANSIDLTGKVVSMIEFGNEALLYEGSTSPKVVIRIPPPSLGLCELFEEIGAFFVSVFTDPDKKPVDSLHTTETEFPFVDEESEFFDPNHRHGADIGKGTDKAHVHDEIGFTRNGMVLTAISEDVTGWGQLPIFYKVDD